MSAERLLEYARRVGGGDWLEVLEVQLGVIGRRRPEVLEEVRGRWSGPAVDTHLTPCPWWTVGPLRVAASVSEARDGSLWWHVSVSRPDRTPTYEELTEVRSRLFRASDVVLHVWPPVAEHFSLHPYCLHLWATLDGQRPVPDLRTPDGGV